MLCWVLPTRHEKETCFISSRFVCVFKTFNRPETTHIPSMWTGDPLAAKQHWTQGITSVCSKQSKKSLLITVAAAPESSNQNCDSELHSTADNNSDIGMLRLPKLHPTSLDEGHTGPRICLGIPGKICGWAKIRKPITKTSRLMPYFKQCLSLLIIICKHIAQHDNIMRVQAKHFHGFSGDMSCNFSWSKFSRSSRLQILPTSHVTKPFLPHFSPCKMAADASGDMETWTFRHAQLSPIMKISS